LRSSSRGYAWVNAVGFLLVSLFYLSSYALVGVIIGLLLLLGAAIAADLALF
jgi:hypothetical protein